MEQLYPHGRYKQYTLKEIRDILEENNYQPEDMTFLSAATAHGGVTDLGDGLGWKVSALGTVNTMTIETEKHPTGIFKQSGYLPVIILNSDRDILDYDFISGLHPIPDAEVYLWSEYPYSAADMPLIVYDEWFRRDTYKDGMRPFDGKTLGWEDTANVYSEEDND